MQSIASLMSIGRVSDIGDMGELDEEEEEEDTASRISEMTSKFYTSVTEEDDSAAALGLTNGATSDFSKLHGCLPFKKAVVSSLPSKAKVYF